MGGAPKTPEMAPLVFTATLPGRPLAVEQCISFRPKATHEGAGRPVSSKPRKTGATSLSGKCAEIPEPLAGRQFLQFLAWRTPATWSMGKNSNETQTARLRLLLVALRLASDSRVRFTVRTTRLLMPRVHDGSMAFRKLRKSPWSQPFGAPGTLLNCQSILASQCSQPTYLSGPHSLRSHGVPLLLPLGLSSICKSLAPRLLATQRSGLLARQGSGRLPMLAPTRAATSPSN